jgi:CheY-like chemotaxis protein
VRLPGAIVVGPEAAVAAPIAAEGPRLRARRALVVDDNLDAADSLAELLRDEGADVETAHDGDEALAIARRAEPHLVLLDIGLPRRNGYEVAREIRQLPWGSGSVIIAMTGWGQPTDRARSREAGFDHHLVKPVSLDTILELVDRR